MKISHVFLLLCVIVISSQLLLQNSKPKTKPSGHKVKIGIIAPFSGVNTSMGTSGLKGVEISQQLMPYLNNGDQIELITIDDRGIPEKSVQAIQTISEEHRLTAIMMFSGSNSVLAVAKVADRYKIPVLALSASHPDVTKYSPLITQFNFDDTFQASVAALYVRDELLLDKVAIITQAGNVHLSYLAKKFSQQFTDVEGLITDTVVLNSLPQDYVTMLQAIQIHEPELLYLPVTTEQLFKIKLALTDMNWNPQIMTSDGLMASVKAQNKYPVTLVEGMLTIDTFANDMQLTPFGEQVENQAFAMGISRQELDIHSVLGMEGYALLITIMNQCKEPENKRTCIDARLRSTSRFQGVMANISIDAQGKTHRPLVINRVRNGKADFVAQVY